MGETKITEQQAEARPPSDFRIARLIAFYLPQFHPIPENDLWWGKGFTEWTNVATARPLFRGHYQPRIPADLGFYDLRVPEVRAAQANLARSAGIEGFCYWHYWFAGKRLLERPFNEVLRLREPDFPFCLAWANRTWSGIWHGAANRVLIEQTYAGLADYEQHFHALLEAFHDPRYIRVRGKPVFVIFRPPGLPSAVEFTDLWQSLAIRNGLPGMHFVAHISSDERPYDYLSNGFAGGIASDAFCVSSLNAWRRSLALYRGRSEKGLPLRSAALAPLAAARAVYLKGQKHLNRWLSRPMVVEYAEAMMHFLAYAGSAPHSYPCVVPNWDHSPRTGCRSVIFHNSSPALFRQHLREALQLVTGRPFEDRIVFVKSWNEWAEGNYLEPDARFGQGYLNAVRQEVLVEPRQPTAQCARARETAELAGGRPA